MPAYRESLPADRTVVAPPPRAETSVAADPGGAAIRDLEQQIVSLQREVADLREAIAARQLIGWALGLLAERLGLSHDQAWQFLVRLSQNTNVRVRDVARVISDAYAGELSPADLPLAAQLSAQLGDDRTLFASSGTRRRPGHGRR